MKIVLFKANIHKEGIDILEADYVDDVPKEDMDNILDIGHSKYSNFNIDYDKTIITCYIDMESNNETVKNFTKYIKYFFRNKNLNSLNL